MYQECTEGREVELDVDALFVSMQRSNKEPRRRPMSKRSTSIL